MEHTQVPRILSRIIDVLDAKSGVHGWLGPIGTHYTQEKSDFNAYEKGLKGQGLNGNDLYAELRKWAVRRGYGGDPDSFIEDARIDVYTVQR